MGSSQRIVDLRKGRSVRRDEPTRPPQRESERRSPLRNRRRKMRFVIASISLVGCLALAWGVRVLSYQPNLTLQTITVVGAQRVPTEMISSYVDSLLDDGRFHFFSRRNIFLYPKAALGTAVSVNYPRIARASVSRDSLFSTDLIDSIVERQPFATWCTEPHEEAPTMCYWMDQQGFLFAEAGENESGEHAYVFTKGLAQKGDQPIGATFSPGHIPGILAVLRNLEAADFQPSGASIEDEQDLFVYLDEGFYIKASYGQHATQLTRNLELILASDALRGKTERIEYVDLRFGNRVYYKFKGEAEVSTQ